MKIASVSANNHRKVFELRVGRKRLCYPYSKATPSPSRLDPVRAVVVDEDLAREAFSFDLASGKRGSVHVEQVLEYNQDPGLIRELLLYNLTIEARKRVTASALSKREIIRRLGTSASQFYRLLDQTNHAKSLDRMVALLQALDCDVRVTVERKQIA
jgi:predicted XRE-type DNA-binding protein